MARRLRTVVILVAGFLVIGVPAAWACGGLIAPNGAVQLLRTSTFAGYADGVEHYVTAFRFAGDTGTFGSIVPLPGVPEKVQKGGDWTLQRLLLETEPPIVAEAAGPQSARLASVEILHETRIDSLDITILRGGGEAVAEWADEQGFELSADAPEVLSFYSARSPVFMAARFDGSAAKEQGLTEGDGTPIHLTIPTENPWVPLRILSLGKAEAEVVEADVFLLTEREPSLLPAPSSVGLSTVASRPASELLLDDLRSDRGMKWVPEQAWLTHLALSEEAGDLTYDLAVDASGAGEPSPVAAGLPVPAPDAGAADGPWLLAALGVAAATLLAIGPTLRRTGS